MLTNRINESTLKRFDISAAALHIIAMTLMLMDHLWATLLPAREWLTCAGRVAFPIFAFMAVEGYFHTRSFKKYILRMLLFAVLSEIPFDLMYGGITHPNFFLKMYVMHLLNALNNDIYTKGSTLFYYYYLYTLL